MSSRNNKNILKAENGQLIFGENFHDLLPGYQSPTPFGEMDMRIIKQAIAIRKEATNPLDDYDELHSEVSPRQANHFDHTLAFFERMMRRIEPHVVKANQKRHQQIEDERYKKLSSLLKRREDLTDEEKLELDVLTTLCVGDEMLAQATGSLDQNDMDLFAIFEPQEMVDIMKSAANDGQPVIEQPSIKIDQNNFEA